MATGVVEATNLCAKANASLVTTAHPRSLCWGGSVRAAAAAAAKRVSGPACGSVAIRKAQCSAKADDSALRRSDKMGGSALNVSALIPLPQCLEELGGSATLDAGWVIVAQPGNDRLGFAAAWLQAHLSAPPLSLHLARAAKRPTSKYIYLGVPTDDSQLVVLLKSKQVGLNRTKLGTEGYVLQSDAGGALVAANHQAGVFHGVQTLLQLITPKAALPAVRIEDFPDSANRAVYMYGSDYDNPGWDPADPPGRRSGRSFISGVLDQMALLKINTGTPVLHMPRTTVLI
jgi:hypothetical protein